MLLLSEISLWLLAPALVLVVIEDFRHRAVYWWLFPLLAVIAVGIEFINFTVSDVFINSCFVLVQLAMLSLYFSIKEKRLVNITQRYLGWGDVLFWFVLCMLFTPLNFVFFFMCSMILVAIVVGIGKAMKIKSMDTVPLAGIQAMAVLIFLCIMFFSDTLSFRNDSWIEKWLTA